MIYFSLLKNNKCKVVPMLLNSKEKGFCFVKIWIWLYSQGLQWTDLTIRQQQWNFSNRYLLCWDNLNLKCAKSLRQGFIIWKSWLRTSKIITNWSESISMRASDIWRNGAPTEGITPGRHAWIKVNIVHLAGHYSFPHTLPGTWGEERTDGPVACHKSEPKED